MYCLLAALALCLPRVGHAETSEATTSTRGAYAELSLIDSGEGAQGDGDGVAEPGETVLFRFLVANGGEASLPELTVTVTSTLPDLNGLAVDLPALGSGEGVEFDASLTVTEPLPPDWMVAIAGAPVISGTEMLRQSWRFSYGAFASGEVSAATTLQQRAVSLIEPGQLVGQVINVLDGKGLSAEVLATVSAPDWTPADADRYNAVHIAATADADGVAITVTGTGGVPDLQLVPVVGAELLAGWPVTIVAGSTPQVAELSFVRPVSGAQRLQFALIATDGAVWGPAPELVFDGANWIASPMFIPERTAYTRSGSDGSFSLNLWPGEWDIEVQASGMRPRRIEGVRVIGGAKAMLDLVLEPKNETIAGLRSSASVEEVVVQGRPDVTKASVVLVVRKKATVVSDRLSAEDMARASDGTASEAVRRAVGTSVVGGKFVYVRGLGERYSYTTLNGSRLPSPEPDRKVVPLDIFSTSVLSNVAIVKTAAPDLAGDFAGGVVQVETRSFPEKRIGKLGCSLGYLASATGKKILDYDGGKLDALGFDDGTRALPSGLPRGGRLFAGANVEGGTLTEANMIDIARRFNNDFTLHRRVAGPDVSCGVTVGDRATPGGRELGWLVSGAYGLSNERTFQIRRKLRLMGEESDGTPILDRATDFSGETGAQNVRWTGLVNLGYRLQANHQLEWTSLLTRKSSDEARLLSGFEQQFNGDLEYTSQRFLSRSLSFNQFSGSHHFRVIDLNWRGAFSIALRDEPDWRELVRTQSEGADFSRWLPKSSSGSHFWSDLREPGFEAALHLMHERQVWNGLTARVGGGVQVSGRDRDFNVRRFRFLPVDNADPAFFILPPEQLLADEQVGVNIRLEEASRPTDSYSASERVYGVWALSDLPLHKRVQLIAGVRFEHSEVSVSTFDPFAPEQTKVPSELTNDDVLPSANIVIRLRDDMNLRLGVSRTVARPDFRELSPFALADFFGGQEVQGNPDLQETKILNVDVRQEWFPSEGAVVAVSLFYKDFVDPIEQVIIPSGQQTISFANARGASNYGVELEARSNLAFLAEAMRIMYGGVNLTWLTSEVSLDPDSGIQTRSSRPLQGQSKVLFNALLGVDLDRGTAAQISYNVFSKRIAQVGAFGMPDIYELPVHGLDLTVSQTIGEAWKLKLAAENLLDEAIRARQGNEIVRRDYEGIAANVGIEWSF
ncbi:MAG: TonB-dependent receptor [Candidatus Dadabacteria bacterium]|nr:MAG: TonB-dependent receptor [Candidatus Dadabacteria bacterium]